MHDLLYMPMPSVSTVSYVFASFLFLFFFLFFWVMAEEKSLFLQHSYHWRPNIIDMFTTRLVYAKAIGGNSL